LIGREVKLLGQRLRIAAGDSLHRKHELFKPRGVAVQLGKHRLAGAFDFILRFTGL
jgi:hypothetical protein